MKGKYYAWITILELVILLAGGVQIGKSEKMCVCYGADVLFADTSEGRVYTNELNPENRESLQELRTEELVLEKGIYSITVCYHSTNNGQVSVSGDGFGPQSMWAENAELSAQDTKRTYQIWANDPIERFRIRVTAPEGTLAIEEIQIETAANSKLYQMICLLLKLLVVNLLAALYCFRDCLRKYSVELVGLAGITLIASVGVLTRYMLPGHDLAFHLLRIEGLKEGLLSGAFPVRIQPNWCNGWGYAVSVMYGDTTLLLPAVMRMVGFTLQTAYKTFVITVNILTAGISFYCFHKICKNRYISLLGSLLYTTAPYRLCCIYIRGAFGEYTAMMFLPLILLGFWYALEEAEDSKEYGRKYLAPVIGFSGLIQTHILTCQMAAVFIVLLCIVCYKRIFRKKTFLYLAKIVVVTAFLNLWFLVPFVQYFCEELNCTKAGEMASDYQMLGVSLAELFAQEASGYYGYSWSELTSLKNKFSIPLGNGLILSGVFAFLLLWNKKAERKRSMKVVLAFAMLSVWMATNLFPYHWIRMHFPKIAGFLAKPGLPYRYLLLACLFCSFLAVLAFQKSAGQLREKIRVSAFLLIGIMAVYQGFAFSYQTLYNGWYEIHYDGSMLNTTNLMGNEYLYEGSETWITEIEKTVTGENVTIISQEKEYNEISVQCTGAGEGAALQIPLFYYPGYVAYDTEDTAVRFEVGRGGNNRICVWLPQGYDGEVTVRFKEPLLWRMAEAVSLLTLAGIVFVKLSEKKRRSRKGIRRDEV